MVEFVMAVSDFEVIVNGKLFGYISKERGGFFTDSTVIKEFLEVSSKDLKEITLKSQEVCAHGQLIPICKYCNGTPYFPKQIYNPNQGMSICLNSIHPLEVR